MQLSPGASAERAIDAALALRDAGRPEAALAPLRQALTTDPGNSRLWQTLGGIHRALEQSAAAVDAFARAAQLAPGDVKAAHGVAQASLEAGRAATALFDRARQLAPGDGTLLIGRAAAQLAEGRAAQAAADLQLVLSSNPLWIEGHATLARLRWQSGDFGAFDASYAHAVQANPRAAQLWLAWVRMLMEVEAFARAAAVIEHARMALAADPTLALLAAVCASELGRLAEADERFASLGAAMGVERGEHEVRHLLRAGRIDAAARLAEQHLDRPGGERLWPYAAIAWRALDDPRREWLEADPALVGVRDLEIGALLAPLADYLRTRHHARAAPAGQSVRAGTQTDGPLFALEAPEIRLLREAVLAAVRAHIAQMGRRDPAHPTRRHIGKPIRFAGSWSVRLTGAGHHSAHIHPQGWISSALYIAVPEQAAMGPAPNGWLQLGEPPASLGLDLPPQREVEPRPGRLVLFPSWMWHGTRPIAGGERLTVAFDVAAIG